MRWLLFLLFPSLLFADSLRVECSADGFIANVTAVRTTGSFTIANAAATDNMCLMDSNNTGTNSSANTTHRLGWFTSSDQRILYRPVGLADSMRTYASGKTIQWDSAIVSFKITTALASGDSLSIRMSELRSTRIFAEGNATWNQYDVSSSWTIPGAGSSVSDVDNSNLFDITWVTSANTGSLAFKLNSAAVTDTINNKAGIAIYATNRGNDDLTSGGTSGTCALILGTDDNATAGNRPTITVYFTELDYVNYGGSDSLIAKSISSAPTHLPFFTFDISSLSATVDLDSCRWWSYVLNNYSVNTESSILSRILQVMKPTNIGDNNGTVADNGEMDWVAWDERGSGNDSNWTVAGAGDEGSTCNRSDGSGDDLYIGQDFFVNWASTGWKTIKFDTLYVRKYLNGGCNNFGLALAMNASAGDVANYKIEADEKSGSANKTWITIYYTPVATTPTRGTGRFGKSTTGAYLNDR